MCSQYYDAVAIFEMGVPYYYNPFGDKKYIPQYVTFSDKRRISTKFYTFEHVTWPHEPKHIKKEFFMVVLSELSV